MSYIFADFKRYNANSNNKNVGDCVKRSLSVAYSEDYNDVSKELNKIKRSLGYQQFNIYPVFSKYLSLRGDSFVKNSDAELTVQEFSEQYSSGVYLILCGKEFGKTSHMVAIVDGNYYDSWDSSEQIVSYYAKVKGASSDVYDLPIEDIANRCVDYFSQYAEKSLNKYRQYFYVFVHMDDAYRIQNENTFKFYLYLMFEDDLPKRSRYSRNAGRERRQSFSFKLNPRLDADKNYESLIKKGKSQIYNFVRKIGEDFKSSDLRENIEDMLPKNHGYIEEDVLSKLPEWTYPILHEAFKYDGSYVVELYNEYGTGRFSKDNRGYEVVEFQTDTLTDLKNKLHHYYVTGELDYY